MTDPENSKPEPAPEAGAFLESSQRFRTLFEQAPFSVQLFAADGRTLQVNKAWRALWNLADDADGLRFVLNEYNVLTDPQLEAKGITPYLHRALAGESVTTSPILYDPAEMGRQGRARWVLAHAHPIRDERGQVREVMLIHEDVTERMESEQALSASEQRLKQLANNIPHLAWMADPDGNIHWYNDRWYEYTGMPVGEGGPWHEKHVHHPDALPAIHAAWRHSLATGAPFQMTFPMRGSDGIFRPFYTLMAPLKDEQGKVVQWFGTNTDVSALQAAEDGLREAEERLRLATDAGNIGIWEWDLARDKVVWSERVYQLHALQPGQFGERAADFLELVHADDRPLLGRKIQAAIDGTGSFSAEFRALLPGGGTRWLSTWARIHHDRLDAADRMIGATISIDAYKKAEEALKESDRRKDEFLAMLAHELRNPLAPISTAAQLLHVPGLDGQRMRQAGDIIDRQVKHMTALVDDLLDVSRVTRGLVQLEKETLDLKSVIASAIEQVRPLMEARRHVLATRTGAGQLCVQGDRTRLVQVLVNLLNNAAKYTLPGGEIDLTADVHNDEVRIAVRDNGIGMDAGLIPHVFDLFTQAARTPDRSQGGLGIGLALVRSIMALHEGRIEVRSEGVGLGSTFTLSLPLLRHAGGESTRQAQPSSRPAAPLRILVVDDNLDAANSLAVLLEIQGHRTRVAEDGRAALAAAGENPPQVLILDIGLPDMDGFALARKLRERKELANALFIALTGYGQSHDRVQSRAAGFDHHFVKPVDVRELERILASAA